MTPIYSYVYNINDVFNIKLCINNNVIILQYMSVHIFLSRRGLYKINNCNSVKSLRKHEVVKDGVF